MGIMESAGLGAVGSRKGAFVIPFVGHRLPIKFGPGIRRRQGDLDGLDIEFAGVFHRFFDSLLGLSRKTENKTTVNIDSKFTAVFRKFFGDIGADAFFDVVENLLIARFIADEQKAKPVFPEYF